MRYFYRPSNSNLENFVDLQIKKFVEIIKKDFILKNYVRSFGLVGPTSRCQGFYLNEKVHSDFDFYIITNYVNPIFEKYLRVKFHNIFKFKDVEFSILVVSPTIFSKPDLMFFEFSNSGKLLFGKPVNKLKIDKIPKFESFRNIVYRGSEFLSLFFVKDNTIILKRKNKHKFYYKYSKVIFSLGEIFLLLKGEYVADNIRRNKKIKTNSFASKLPGFMEEHQKAYDFRYSGKLPSNFNFNDYTNKAFKYISFCYSIIFGELFGSYRNYFKLKSIHPSGLSSLVNKFLFTISYFFKFKKLKFHLFTEPFIVLIILNYNFIEDIIKKNKINQRDLKELINYWKIAGWFYHSS